MGFHLLFASSLGDRPTYAAWRYVGLERVRALCYLRRKATLAAPPGQPRMHRPMKDPTPLPAGLRQVPGGGSPDRSRSEWRPDRCTLWGTLGKGDFLDRIHSEIVPQTCRNILQHQAGTWWDANRRYRVCFGRTEEVLQS